MLPPRLFANATAMQAAWDLKQAATLERWADDALRRFGAPDWAVGAFTTALVVGQMGGNLVLGSIAARFGAGLTGWTLLGPGAVTVRAGGPGGVHCKVQLGAKEAIMTLPDGCVACVVNHLSMTSGSPCCRSFCDSVVKASTPRATSG